MGNKLYTSLALFTAVLVTSATVAQFDPENVNPCDTTDDACSLTKSAPPANNLVNSYYGMQAHNMMVGSRFPLQPYTETLPKIGGHGLALPGSWTRNWQLSPVYDSDIRADAFPKASTTEQYGVDPYDCNGTSATWSAARPNEFDTLFVQGIYQNDMWKSAAEKPDTFAKRTIYMVGTHTAGLGNVSAKTGDSIPSAYADAAKNHHGKYAYGSVNQGVHLSGGRFYKYDAGGVTKDMEDQFIATGSANMAWLAFSSAEDLALPASGASVGSFGPNIVGSTRGSDSHAIIGKRLVGINGDNGSINTGADARNLFYKESDQWAPGSAIVRTHYGATGAAWLDTARSGLQVIPGKMMIEGADYGADNIPPPLYRAGPKCRVR